MSFLEEITIKLSDVGAIASKKTQELKLQNLVYKEKKKRDDLFKSLGSAYYEKYKEEADCEFKDYISQILVSEETIQSYFVNTELKTHQCSACHKFIEENLAFCPHCGMNLDSTESLKSEPPVDDAKSENTNTNIEETETSNLPKDFCINCGSSLQADAVFCVECGNKI